MSARHGPVPVRFLVLVTLCCAPLLPIYLGLVPEFLNQVLSFLYAQPGRYIYAAVCVLLMLGQALLFELLTGALARSLWRRKHRV